MSVIRVDVNYYWLVQWYDRSPVIIIGVEHSQMENYFLSIYLFQRIVTEQSHGL